MAFFLRSPRIDYRSRERMLSVLRIDGQGNALPLSEHVYVHDAPIVLHDRCAHAEGLENHSRELAAEWKAAKRAVIDDHASRGEINPRTGEGWSIPSPTTPDEIIDRLSAAGAAVNAYRDPISTLAGAGWDLCWSPLYSDRPRRATLLRVWRPRDRDGLTMTDARQTIDITPNWASMRRFVLHVFRTDPVTARKIAAEMGSEAPELPDTDRKD
jgi:hypothetical protein